MHTKPVLKYLLALVFGLVSFISIPSYCQTEGDLDRTFNFGQGTDYQFNYEQGVDLNIYTTALLPDGKMLIGGNFYSYNNEVRNVLARLNANGTLDTTVNAGIESIDGENYVNTIAVQPDGKIIIGGLFSSVHGVTRNNIARLNANGSLDATFNPGTGTNNNLHTLALQPDGKMIIVGAFTSFNGTTRNRIARLNANGSLDATFNPGTGSNATLQALALQTDGKILIGGDFTSYNSTTRNYFTRLNSDGSLDVDFPSGIFSPNNSVLTIALTADGAIFIGGAFTRVNNQRYDRIALLRSDGNRDPLSNYGLPSIGPDGNVRSIVIQNDGKVIIGGDFNAIGMAPSIRIARLTTLGGLDYTFNTGLGANDKVATIALQTDGKIIAVGEFSSINDTLKNHIARLNTNGSLDNTFNPKLGFNTAVETGAAQTDGKVIIAGDFTSYNGISRNRIARLNANGSLDGTFNPGTSANNKINAIIVQADNKTIIGGQFTSFSGTARNYIARLNTNGTLDATFNPGTGANGFVRTIALQTDGKIIIGGDFTSYNGTTRNYIARLNTDGTLDASFNPSTGANNTVRVIVVQPDGKILIGGNFTTFNGTALRRIARLNTNGSLDAAFNPGSGANDIVHSIALQADGKIYVAGDFSNFGNLQNLFLARMNANGSLDISFSPLSWDDNTDVFATAKINSIALQPNGNLIVGGAFTSYNNITKNYLARLNDNGTLDANFNNGAGANGAVNFTILQSDGKLLIGGNFKKYNNLNTPYIARIQGFTHCSIPATPTISGNNSFCNGGSTVLTSSATSGNLWSNGATTRSITVTTPGNYSVRVINNGCSSLVSANVTVISSNLPPVSITANGSGVLRNLVCEGDFTFVVLTSSSATGNLWSNGETSRSISVRAGDYSVSVSNGICTNTSNIFSVEQVNNPTPTIIGNRTFSPGSSTILTSSSTSSNLWSNGATTQSITVSAPGIYSVRSIESGCTSAVSEQVQVDLVVSNYTVTTIAGSGSEDYVDGIGTAASFYDPRGMAMDCAGNLYVADAGNHRIRKITPAGLVTTFAGSGTIGNADGLGTAASFNVPSGLAIDPTGNLYVADTYNNLIRKITPSGLVTTLAGGGDPFPDGGGVTDGIGANARFFIPYGIAIDQSGHLYVTTYTAIRKVSPTGVVTTLAGSSQSNFADGTGAEAMFSLAAGIAVDASGNVFVADANNNRIRRITPAGVVTTFAGSGNEGFSNGTGTAASFNAPFGVTLDGSGNAYVADYYNNSIRKISPSGVVSSIAGTGTAGFANGIAANASFNGPFAVTVDFAGNLFVADGLNNRIRKISVPCTTPATPTIIGNNSFCSGGSTVLTSSAATGYMWSNCATTRSITVTEPGNYFVRVMDGGCISEPSTTFAVTVVNTLTTAPTISSTGGTQICIGETTTLSAGTASRYMWSNGATTPTITVGAGTYSVNTVNASGCTSAVSSDMVIDAIACQNTFTGTGTFGEGARWTSTSAPISTESAIIDGIATLSGNVTVNNLVVNTAKSVVIPSGLTLTVTGNLNNLGTISGDGTLRLAGSNNQSFGGGTVANLQLNNNATIIQNSETMVTGTLTLGNSQVLNLNNLGLTLVSTALGTARIAPIPASASITNAANFTQQRWLDRNNVRRTTANNGNYFLTGPVVTGKNVNLWNGVSPYNNATYVEGGVGNLYFYNGATNTWFKPSSPTQSLAVGKGIQVWFGFNNFFANNRNHWSVTGSPVVGTYEMPLANQAGFQLVANPYPSTIDWDSPSWTKTGVANAIYIYDWKNQRYNTYINGIGTNGASRYLPTAQGFFVNTTITSPVLTATESIKVSNQVAMQRSESTVNGFIRLAINNNGVEDEMVIANRATANIAFEADQDAQKMMNPTTNIFVSGAVNQSIASMNLNGVNSIPFVLQTNSTGTVTVTTTEISGIEAYTFNLFNEQTGELLPYTGTETYSFNVTANQPYRLQLRIGSVTGISNFKANVFEVFPNPATDKVTITTTGAGTLQIVNVVGQVVLSQLANETNEINISKLSKGVYTVKFNGASQKLVVK